MLILLPFWVLVPDMQLLQAVDMGSPTSSPHGEPPSMQDDAYYVMLLGETGSGKSTLLNMFVNFFRGQIEARTALPKGSAIRAAVPTAYVAITEPEGAAHSERNATDSELAVCAVE